MNRFATFLLLIPAMVATLVTSHAGAMPEFSPDELKRIATLGPWPPAFTRDPSNRVSGKPLAIELGRRMFSDARMSPVGYIACVTCHQPDRAFTDLRARAHGLADLPRNTPTLANLRLQRWYGWTGASDSLWMASIRPMLDARELDSSPAFVRRVFERDPDLAACYRRVFDERPRDSLRTVVNVGKALAAFEETLITGRTPFDEFRDALRRGDAVAAARYPQSALRGLKLFVGQGGCAGCHSGPNFSDGKFHRTGSTAFGLQSVAFADEDAGRLDGVKTLRDSPLNLAGPHNDDVTHVNAIETKRARPEAAMRGQFRTPSLRNVAVTAPYMHDGRIERLRAAIAHEHGPAGTPPLTASHLADLEQFLLTLTDRDGAQRPWPPASRVNCP